MRMKNSTHNFINNETAHASGTMLGLKLGRALQ